MIDVANWLAAKSDSPLNLPSDQASRLTVSAAQLSYLLLQHTLHDIDADELRILPILRDHARLSTWSFLRCFRPLTVANCVYYGWR
jgi:hypothetical protein